MAAGYVDSWIFTSQELADSPSLRDGIDAATEAEHRYSGIIFLLKLGEGLRLKIETVATACIYFHRFFVYQSFRSFDPRTMAQCCLFAAAKCEDIHATYQDRPFKVSITSIIRKSHEMLFPGTPLPAEDSQIYNDLLSDVLACERILLPTIGFDLTVSTPYKYLTIIGPSKRPRMFKACITMANTLLATDMFLRYPVPVLACSMIACATSRAGEEEKFPAGVDVYAVFNKHLGVNIKHEQQKPLRAEIVKLMTQMQARAKELSSSEGEEAANGRGHKRSAPEGSDSDAGHATKRHSPEEDGKPPSA